MQIRIFSLSLNSDAAEQEEMNKFLRSHRVIETRQQYDETRGVWTFAVSYVEGAQPMQSNNASSNRPERVDYKSVLSAEAFEVFSRLREQRKLMAKDEAVPAYAIFTDKELAQMAELDNLSPQCLSKIEGINRGRIERYGIRLIEGYFATMDKEDEAPRVDD